MIKVLLYLLLFAVSWPVAIALAICYVLYVACSLTVKVIFYMSKGGLTATAAYIKARDETAETVERQAKPAKAKAPKPTFVNERGQVVR